jgi:DNA uptake protein ComE-like DNA-binding protein
MDKTKINLANPQELLEIPGIDSAARDAIVHHRAEHGPIEDVDELARVVGLREAAAAWAGEVDFDPANQTAPEAPGA